MMLSLYVALGIFLLIAVRNPSAHRSLIAFAAWSSFAHAAAMSILGLEIPNQRTGFLVGSGVLVVIGVVLIVLEATSRVSLGGGGVALACLENSSGSWPQALMFLDSQVPIFVMRTPAVPERLRTETLTKRFPVRPQSISMSA
jgi:hypothetical protein